jgi:tripartite-type tricarboxylate transporter receptor subunit TctC
MSNQRAGWSRRQILGALGVAMLGAPALGRAQSDRPIKFILPVGVGSGVDTITRSAGPALSTALGHTVVVENQPGAGGIVGTSALVRSAPDGYTLSMLSNNHVIFPSVYKSLPFDPLTDITPISMVGMTPFLIVANPKQIAAGNLKELTAVLSREPGRYNYASSGNGTILHLAAEMYVQQAGVKARHIPYKGVGPMMADLIGGQVDFGVLSLPSVLPQIKSGALKALAACGGERMAALPRRVSRAWKITRSGVGSPRRARRNCRRPMCAASTTHWGGRSIRQRSNRPWRRRTTAFC